MNNLVSTISDIQHDFSYYDSFKLRSFGWIQNPTDFNKLKQMLNIFIEDSYFYKELVTKKIPCTITDQCEQNRLLDLLCSSCSMYKYTDLVGTGSSIRSQAKCNSIIQAALIGRNKINYLDNWTSDSFLRWAVSLGYLKYHYGSDTLSITDEGICFAESSPQSSQEYHSIMKGITSYPPVSRILYLLQEREHLTKYELAKELGLVGEASFSSLDQDEVLDQLAHAEPNMKNNIRRNRESTNDKYARILCTWLMNLHLVYKRNKYFTFHGNDYTEYISHAYILTPKGIDLAYQQYKQPAQKNVCWEMFATRGVKKHKIRKRNAMSILLKALQKSSEPLTYDDLIKILARFSYILTEEELKYYLKELSCCGFLIQNQDDHFLLQDNISNFTIPINA